MQLSDTDISLLRELQKEFPLCEEPFAVIAERVGLTEGEAISRIREWMESGVIRKAGVFIRHGKAGYQANGMAVWNVPSERLEEIGGMMSGRRRVSHCYARPSSDKWPYNIYTMIHGRTREEVEDEAREISAAAGGVAYKVLFSKRELKKSDTRLFMEEDE
ncbi:MAG TPA: AsnC family transcriptional regulator [bacterium]|nr:AsnC family transcriptional regulator [bacterium]